MPSGSAIPTRSFRIALASILVVALVVRIGTAERYDLAPQTDAADYDRHAVEIATNLTYPEATVFTGGPGPTAWRPPVYPLALGAVYAITGTEPERERWAWGRRAQALIGALVVALVAVLALQLWGRLEALCAAALAAIYLPFVHAGASLLTEPLFTLLFLAGAAALMQYRSDERLRWLLVAGACAGLATLTRTNGVILIGLFALGAWTGLPRLRARSLAAPAATIAVALLVIAPWSVRNAFALDAFVPLTTQTGVATAGQYNELADAREAQWVPPYEVPRLRPLFFGEPLGEVELSARLSAEARGYALEHPSHVADAVLRNTLRFLNLDDPFTVETEHAAYTGQPAGLARASVVAFWILAPLALVGALTAAARRLPAFLWLVPLLLLVSVVLLAGFSRYRIPGDAVLLLLAGLPCAQILRRAMAASRPVVSDRSAG